MSSSTKTNPGRTNQKLYFAKLQQGLLEQALAGDGFAAEPTALACREAVIFHLHGAYLSFLHELCRFYKLPDSLDSTEALRLAMAAKGQVSPEVVVLQQWEQDASSWLAGLLAAHAECLRAQEAVKVEPEAEHDQGHGHHHRSHDHDHPHDHQQGRALEKPAAASRLIKEIAIVHTDSDRPLSEPDRARLGQWHQALTTAIREFRSEMMEW
jgi:hypothetical protein